MAVHEAFGLRFRTTFGLPEVPASTRPGLVHLEVSLGTEEAVAAAFSGPLEQPAISATVLGDGCDYVTERGRVGDFRIGYGNRASFHLSATGSELVCAPADPDEASWRRFLLDSGLVTAAMVQGREAIHAGAIERSTGVMAVVGQQEAGKSTLVAEFVRRGSALFCDDVVCVSRVDGSVRAHPGPPLMNLPPTLPDGTPAERIGRVLATIDGECWVAIDHASAEARPIDAFVFLERGDHAALTIERLPATPAALLQHTLVSGADPSRLTQRFELFGDLAATALLLRARAPARLPAAAVADALDALLGEAVSVEW